jgi:hypothetical protein
MSHVGVVARAVTSTVAALILLAAVILGFIWYRRRYNIRRSSTFSSGAMEAASGGEVTPFVPSRPEITHRGPMTGTVHQQPQSWLVPTTVATNAETYDPYSSPSGLHSLSLTPDLVGLSDKELARMCAENLHSQTAIDTTPVTLPGDASSVRYRCTLGLERLKSTRLATTRHTRRPARYVDATGPPARDHSAWGYSLSPLFSVLWTRSLDCK